MSDLITVTDDEFFERFKPIQNHLDDNASFDGCMFETFGEELAFVLQQHAALIWTLVDADDGLAIIEGYRLVNRIGYFIAEVPRPPDTQWHICIEVPTDDADASVPVGSALPSHQQQEQGGQSMPTQDTYTNAVTANLAALASGLIRASTLAQMASDAATKGEINLAIGTVLPLKDELPMLHGLLTAAIALRHQT